MDPFKEAVRLGELRDPLTRLALQDSPPISSPSIKWSYRMWKNPSFGGGVATSGTHLAGLAGLRALGISEMLPLAYAVVVRSY